MNGEDVLGEIDTDGDNGHGLPLSTQTSELMRFRTSHRGTWMPIAATARRARDGEVPFIRFPLSKLKIDRSFVNDIHVDDNDKAIVDAILTLAHKMGMRTVAEGVETVQQLQHLQALGCDECQGYLFAKPCPAQDLAPLLGWDHRRFLQSAGSGLPETSVTHGLGAWASPSTAQTGSNGAQ